MKIENVVPFFFGAAKKRQKSNGNPWKTCLSRPAVLFYPVPTSTNLYLHILYDLTWLKLALIINNVSLFAFWKYPSTDDSQYSIITGN